MAKKNALSLVALEQLRGFRVGGRVGVGVAQQALDRRENGRNVVDRRPLVLQDVEANTAVGVNVRMEHLRREAHFRGLVGELLAKREVEREGAALPRRVLRTEDDCRPVHNVVVSRRAGNAHCKRQGARARRWRLVKRTRGVRLQPFKVTHKPATRRRAHWVGGAGESARARRQRWLAEGGGLGTTHTRAHTRPRGERSKRVGGGVERFGLLSTKKRTAVHTQAPKQRATGRDGDDD